MNDQTQDIKISVIGLGYVGLPLSCLLSRKFEVVGYEKDYRKVEDILRGKEVVREPGLQALLNESLSTGRLSLTSDTSRLVKSNIKIITVGTPFILQTMETDFSQLDSSLNDIIPQLNKGDILILKSTVPPGTTMGRVKDIVEKSGLKVPDDIGLSFSPERMVEGQAISDFLSLPKIIGASDDKTSSIVKEIFSALGGTIVEVSSPETAEMVKMVDNYSRFVFIGLTNEIALMSEKVGVDVIELIKSAKLDYPRNAGLLKPGPGVGGSCLNKDPFILESYMLKKGLKLEMVEAAKSINYGMASHVVSLVKKFSYGKKNITVLGVAFKGDTNDTRFTTAFQIKNELSLEGYSVTLTDPYVKMGDQHIEDDTLNALKDAEILLLLTDHSQYVNLNLSEVKGKMAENPVIIDTRAMIDRKIAEQNGFEYHGLGRL